MPRTCTVCSHARRAEIDKLLAAGNDAYRNIAQQFRISPSALTRHKPHITHAVAKSHQAKRDAEAIDLVAELQHCLDYVRRLQRAADRWLTDPDNPTEYDLSPRDSDVMVVYSVPKGNARIRKKAKLSRLLRSIEDGIPGAEVDRGETRTADPRTLILSASDSMRDQVRLIAELVGKLQTQGTGQYNISVLAPQLMACFHDMPDELRWRVAERLAALEAGKPLPIDKPRPALPAAEGEA